MMQWMEDGWPLDNHLQCRNTAGQKTMTILGENWTIIMQTDRRVDTVTYTQVLEESLQTMNSISHLANFRRVSGRINSTHLHEK